MAKKRKIRRTPDEIRLYEKNKVTVTCKVDKEVWLNLNAIREAYNCKSIYVLVSGLIDMFCKRIPLKRALEIKAICPEVMNEQTLTEEIEDMFSELSSYESPRYGERTKRGHKAWDYFGEQESTSIDILIEQESSGDMTDDEDEQG